MAAETSGRMAPEATLSSYKRNPRAGSLITDSAAALVSSSAFATAFYPLHRVKILLQTQDINPLVVTGQIRRYTVFDAVPRLVHEGGLRELWRGNAAYMARHVPSTTLSFAFKDALLRIMPHYGSNPGDLGKVAVVNLTAGFIGGAAALLLVYPLDFATIRMASELRQSKKAQGVMDTLNSTQRAGGIAALYRGYGVSAAAIGAYKALYFGLYDTACTWMEQRAVAKHAITSSSETLQATAAAPATAADSHPLGLHVANQTHGNQHSTSHIHSHGHHLGLLERWAAANVVVVTASSLTYPLDVVRKRLVADTALGPERQQYVGFGDCVRKIARAEGVRGFYRFYGYDMLLRLGGGVLLVLYDEMKTLGPAAVLRQIMTLSLSPAGAAAQSVPPAPHER